MLTARRDMKAALLSAIGSGAEWDTTAVSYRHYLKAARVLMNVERILRAPGVTETEYRTIYPALLQVEALIYRGDVEYENRQLGTGAQAGSSWRQGIERVLAGHGFDSPGTLALVARFEHYFEEESRLLRADAELSDEVILDVNYLRCSDILLLLRMVYAFMGRPCDEEFLRVVHHWLALGEVGDDLASYENDAASGSFNTLTLLMRVHGTEAGWPKAWALMGDIMRNGLRELERADKSTVVRFCGAMAGRELPFLAAVPRRLLLTATNKIVMRTVRSAKNPVIH